MEKFNKEKILEVQEKIDKYDFLKLFKKMSEEKMVDKALEFHKRGNIHYSNKELLHAYQNHYLFITFATFILKKGKDMKYINVMMGKEMKDSMTKLEMLTNECFQKDELEEKRVSEKAKAELKSKQSKQPDFQPNRTPSKLQSGNGANGYLSSSDEKFILKPDAQYEPATLALRDSISSTELNHTVGSDKSSVLLIDCRSEAEFSSCTLAVTMATLINVPPELNTPGLSAGKLGEKLCEKYRTLWGIRSTFDMIVLFDQYSRVTPNSKASSLERLLIIIKEFDVNTKYKASPLLLEGGFDSWFCHFPYLTTNPTQYKEALQERGYQLPNQTSLNDINYSYHFDTTPPEPDPEPAVESTPPPALEPSGETTPAVSATQPSETCDVMQPQEPEPSQPKPRIPHVDRSAKPVENTKGPLISNRPQEKNIESVTPRPNRTVSTDGDMLSSRVAGLTFNGDIDRGRTNRPFGSNLNRSSSFPNLSQMNGGETLHEGRTSSNVPEFDRTKKPTQDRVSHYERRENSVAGTNVGPGLTGLKNLGNTCYINSILQCLSNTTPLRQFFQSEFRRSFTCRSPGTGRPGTGCRLAEEFQVIFNMLWAGDTRYFSPNRFKDEVGKMKRTFRGYEQQDSHEFLTILMDSLHEDLKEPESKTVLSGACVESGEKSWGEFLTRNKSIVSDLFYGQLKSTVICLSCQETSSTFEVFSNVSLPLPSHDHCSLRDCLDLYLKDEEIQGWHCPRCKTKRDARKKLDITKLPPILVLHFKRFTSDGWCRKKQTSVEFPETNLNMVEYTAANSETRDFRYDLYAVSNHYGTMESGHYTAYCKNKYKWYKFDDSDVTEISASKVKSPAAYILFYMSSRMDY